MNDIWKPTDWRSFATKVAALDLVLTALALVFAAQLYWSGNWSGVDWPLRISWKQALLHSLIEWCPWLVLSPLVLWLAEYFRLDRRGRRLSGVLPHLVTCLLVALCYHGISVILTDYLNVYGFHSGAARQFQMGANPPIVLSAPPEVFAQQDNGGPGGIAAGGGGFVLTQGEVSIHVQSASAPGPSSNVAPMAGATGLVQMPLPFLSAATDGDFITVNGGIITDFSRGTVQMASHFIPTASESTPPFPPSAPGPWTRFFHLAAIRAQYTIPIYWAIVCGAWVMSYYSQLRERERRTLELEARLTQANLQSLKMQLQPHFLFNTLNAISSLVYQQPKAADDMIGSLSDFLRMNLDAVHQHEVPLRRELEFLNLYFEIQQIRFGDRLRIQQDIDPEALDVAVPTLILQPLVENSVRHGIEARETGGTILIRAIRIGDSLRLEVIDNGEGFKGGQLAAIREGVGLSNTKARLQELYGAAHRFIITANTGGGLVVTVEIPWLELQANCSSLQNEPVCMT